jgi:hypothetical protein
LTMPKMMSDLFMGASIIIIIEHESHPAFPKWRVV